MDRHEKRREGLHRVSKDSDNVMLNVVFVHGLGGGAYSTWDCGEAGALGFWPDKLAQEHPNSCVWTLHYTARILEWNPFARGRSIDLLDRAVWLVQTLLQKRIPARPIVFVTHSLGGVLVKQALQFARLLGPEDWRTVWEQTQAVVFLATPHVGARLADAAVQVAEVASGVGPIARWVLRPSPALKNLVKNNPTLRYLSDWYRDQSPEQGIRTLAFSEGRPCHGVMVVDASSANPQVANGVVVPLPEDDHVSIAKPGHPQHLVFAGVSSLLTDLEEHAAAESDSLVQQVPRPDKSTLALQAERRRLAALLCGDWWERIHLEDASAISLFRIQPDPLFNTVFLGGISFNADGEPSAEWSSAIARVDKIGDKLELKYVWTGKHKDPKRANIPFHGFGSMRFDEPAKPGDLACRGTGEFWNVDEFSKETLLKPIDLRRVVDQQDVLTVRQGTKQERKALIAKRLAPGIW